MQALELKKLPCMTLSAAGAATGWNGEWDAELGVADWSSLRLPLETLAGAAGPVSDDVEVDLAPVSALRRRVVLQPLHGPGGTLLQWLAYLLPLPPACPESELVGALPLRTLMGLGSNHFIVTDAEGRLVLWNRRVEVTAGRGYEQLAGMPLAELFEGSERPTVAASLDLLMRRDSEIRFEGMVRTPNGARPYLFWGSRFKCEGRYFMVSMGIDIAQRRLDEENLRLRDRALYATPNGIVITRCEGIDNPIEYVNPAFESITGYSAQEAIGRDSRFMASPGHDEAERAQLREAIRERRQFSLVLRNRRKNGEVFWNELNVTPVADERGFVTHYVGVINDVTASKLRTSHLEHEVNHDPLTGLANRNLLWDRLEQAIYVAQRNKTLVAALLVDLNKFKQINDTLGHEAGDQVLKVVARRLQTSVRESDTVARLSGDEFVLVLANQPSLRYTLRMVQRIRAGMAKPVMFDSKEIMVAGSIGVSVYPHDGATPFDLVRAADTAMYHAKAAGGRDVHFFSPAMKSATEEKQQLEADLRHAIDHDELFLVFQPRMGLRSGTIVGVEALLRWRHPHKGVLLPASFLLDAEENGLIVPMGQWVTEHVCQALQRLKLLGFSDISICMKASYREFMEEHFVANIAECLKAHRLDPGIFELGVRESHLIRNPSRGSELAHESADLGIHLGVDDVGEGETNLAYLHTLPFDHIRMARAPVNDIGVRPGSGALAKSIINLGHNLGINVIAKGVETAQQRDFLATEGCDELQGNFFSAPVSQEGLERMLGAAVA